MSALDPKTLVRGLIAWMRQENIAATRTRLMKFLYLADLHHARYKGTTATGWQWRVDAFGPLAVEGLDLLDRGAQEQWLRSTALADEPGEPGAILYDLEPSEVRAAAELLPPVFGPVRRWIREYGSETAKLLRFVYGNTEPMEGAREGDFLDFTRARPVEAAKPIPSKPFTRRQEKRFAELLGSLRKEYDAAKAENARLADGPHDAAYLAGLPDETETPIGEVILRFPRREGN